MALHGHTPVVTMMVLCLLSQATRAAVPKYPVGSWEGGCEICRYSIHTAAEKSTAHVK